MRTIIIMIAIVVVISSLSGCQEPDSLPASKRLLLTEFYYGKRVDALPYNLAQNRLWNPSGSRSVLSDDSNASYYELWPLGWNDESVHHIFTAELKSFEVRKTYNTDSMFVGYHVISVLANECDFIDVAPIPRPANEPDIDVPFYFEAWDYILLEDSAEAVGFYQARLDQTVKVKAQVYSLKLIGVATQPVTYAECRQVKSAALKMFMHEIDGISFTFRDMFKNK